MRRTDGWYFRASIILLERHRRWLRFILVAARNVTAVLRVSVDFFLSIERNLMDSVGQKLMMSAIRGRSMRC